MNIFEQIKNSIYSKVYYKETVLTESVNQSIKYLAKVSLLIATLGVVIMTCFIPTTFNHVKSLMTSSISYYPEDLTISINQGVASINRPEPYFIKVPATFLNPQNPAAVKISNLLTINTAEPFNIDKFKEYGTVILLTQKELISVDNSGSIKITSIAKFPNVIITKDWLRDKEVYLVKMLPIIAVLVLILAFILLFIVQFLGILITLFLYALLVWALLKIRGQEVTYKKSYQVAVHASTLILLVNLIGLFVAPINNFLLKILILILIIYLNFDKVSTLTSIEEKGNIIENKETLVE